MGAGAGNNERVPPGAGWPAPGAGQAAPASAADLTPLWQPFQLGPVRLRNRVFVSAHTTNFGRDNAPTGRHVAYHQERAAGGVALIITEGVRVHPASAARDTSLGAYTDAAIPAYAAMAEGAHEEGAAMFAQLLHLGRQAAGDLTRTAAWAPSPRPWATGTHVPHAMGKADIRTVTSAFGAAAHRMGRAGFDGLEVHLGHGHLLQQFLSPATNHRGDAYGGSLQGRLRLAREVLAEVFSATGEDRPVGIRISADEFLPGGLVLADMLEVTGLLTAEFPLAFVHVSHSAYAGSFTLATQMADMSFPSAPFRAFPAAVKAEFPDLPVLAVCRLDDVESAAAVLSDGAADLVGMTRAHIADPHLLRKAQQRQRDTVRSCLACNQGCIGRIEQNLPMSCVVNPEVGFEREWREFRDRAGPAPRPAKRVLVAGAGPAGLRAALSARHLGHDVVLAEAAADVGGQIALAARMTGRSRLGLLVTELARDARAAGVQLRLGAPVTTADVTGGGWDAVVLATGSAPVVTAVPGCRTLTPAEAINAAADGAGDAPSLAADAGIAIFDELGDWAGAGLAEHLASAGRRVFLLTPIAGLAWNITTYSRLGLVHRLGQLGVRVLPLRRPVRGGASGLVIADTMTGDESLLPGVTAVVHAGPPAAADGLFRDLELIPGAPPAVLVGDAYAPRSALEAVFEAHLAVARLLAGETVLTTGGADDEPAW